MESNKNSVFNGNYVFPFENNGLNPNTASSANTFYDIDYLSLLLSRD